MNLIVAVDKNWAIGMSNKLLVTIPNDQKHFREETLGKVVVLGRKTLAQHGIDRSVTVLHGHILGVITELQPGGKGRSKPISTSFMVNN